MIFDNSEGKHDLIAKKTMETEIDIFNVIKFNKLKKQYYESTQIDTHPNQNYGRNG